MDDTLWLFWDVSGKGELCQRVAVAVAHCTGKYGKPSRVRHSKLEEAAFISELAAAGLAVESYKYLAKGTIWLGVAKQDVIRIF